MLHLINQARTDASTVYDFVLQVGKKQEEKVAPNKAAAASVRLLAAAGLTYASLSGIGLAYRCLSIISSAAFTAGLAVFSYNVSNAATNAENNEQIDPKAVFISAATKTKDQALNFFSTLFVGFKSSTAPASDVTQPKTAA